jgi:hypothetical protein
VSPGLAGRVLDHFIACQVLAALRPGAVELSLSAADDVMRERSASDENWRQRLERARTQATRIERQYQAAEPENRLVQRTLERRWEEALQEVRRLEEEYARFRQTQPTTLTSHEVEQIRELARDLPTLWGAPTTTTADRQQSFSSSSGVEVEIEGVGSQTGDRHLGGFNDPSCALRPVVGTGGPPISTVMARIRELRAGRRRVIARQLSTEASRRPGRCGSTDIISRLVRKRARSNPGDPRVPGWVRTNGCDRSGSGDQEDASSARWVPRLPDCLGRCVCWADELERLVRLARPAL